MDSTEGMEREEILSLAGVADLQSKLDMIKELLADDKPSRVKKSKDNRTEETALKIAPEGG